MNELSRRSLLALGAGTLLTVPSLKAAVPTGPKVPRPAGELVVSLNGGEQVLLSQYRGKVVVLELLLTTCPHCQRCARTIQSVWQEYAPKGVQALGAAVNDEARTDLIRFLAMTGAHFPVGTADKALGYKFLQVDNQEGPVYFPQLVLLDRKGQIRYQFDGTNDFFKEEDKNLRAALDKLLAEPAAASTVHKPTASKKKK